MGELPATAITGFGFQYQKERPVAPVEVVRNLGLRPNPIPGQRKLGPIKVPYFSYFVFLTVVYCEEMQLLVYWRCAQLLLFCCINGS